MSIGFIGAGRVGTAFGYYLSQHNYAVSGYYSLEATHAKKAADKTNSTAYASLELLVEKSDIIAITTPDDIIPEIVKQFLEMKMPLNGKMICHMSGSLSIEVLEPLYNSGASLMTLHPLQSIATVELGIEAFDNCYFAVEGPMLQKDFSLETITVFWNAVGRPTLDIRPGEKGRYHVAAVMASNYLTALLNEAIQQMVLCGFSESEGLKALKPLIMGTVNNIETLGTVSALTGPIVRGDVGTVRRHLSILENNPQGKRVYKTLGASALSLAKKTLNHNSSKDESLEHLFREGEL